MTIFQVCLKLLESCFLLVSGTQPSCIPIQGSKKGGDILAVSIKISEDYWVNECSMNACRS